MAEQEEESERVEAHDGRAEHAEEIDTGPVDDHARVAGEEQWSCTFCTFCNSIYLSNCEMCDKPCENPSILAAATASDPAEDDSQGMSPPPPPPPGGPSQRAPSAASSSSGLPFAPPRQPPEPQLVPGLRVWGFFYGEWHLAQVRRVQQEDGRVEVLWESEWSISLLPREHVALLQEPSSKAAASRRQPLPGGRSGSRSWASVVAAGSKSLRQPP